MTFTTDIDNLIRGGYGDVKKLRNIKDTIKHDNFITTVDKQYVESLILAHLRNQPLDESKVTVKSTYSDTHKGTRKDTVSSVSLFSGANNKKLGILGGAAAVIALVVVIGFYATTMSPTDTITSSAINTTPQQLSINVDETSYNSADIIAVSGSTKHANGNSIELSIENTGGVIIWKEFVKIKNYGTDDGKFSTLVIAGGDGWDSNGTYILSAHYDGLENKIKFGFST